MHHVSSWIVYLFLFTLSNLWPEHLRVIHLLASVPPTSSGICAFYAPCISLLSHTMPCAPHAPCIQVLRIRFCMPRASWRLITPLYLSRLSLRASQRLILPPSLSPNFFLHSTDLSFTLLISVHRWSFASMPPGSFFSFYPSVCYSAESLSPF